MTGGDEADVRTPAGPAVWVPGGAEAGGLVAAVAEGLAVTAVGGAVDDGTGPGSDDPQPASAASAATAAAVTGKRLSIL